MKMMVLAPSRGRPENALRLLDRFYDTTSMESDIRIIIDEDEPRKQEYNQLLMGDYIMSFGERLRLGALLNKYGTAYAPNHEIIGFMGDDVYPSNAGWDEKIFEAMTPNGIVYCNDGWQGQNLPTAVFMDSNIIKTMGFMVPLGMTHLFIDNYWYELGKRLGTLTYLEDVYLEHLHPFAGKAETDKTYEEANAGHIWTADEEILKKFIDYGTMDAWVEKLKR
jgi:hypothetical protein